MSSKPTNFLKIAVPLRTAVLQLPSKSCENRPKRSAFVHFSRNGGIEMRSGRTGFSGEFSGKFSVGRAARRDVASQPAT